MKKIDNHYHILLHLSVLSCLVFPLGNIIIPVILWKMKKDEVTGLNEAGKNLTNYQISWTVLLFLSIIVYGLVGLFSISFLVGISLFALNVILPIHFALLIKNGEPMKKYPIIMKFVK